MQVHYKINNFNELIALLDRDFINLENAINITNMVLRTLPVKTYESKNLFLESLCRFWEVYKNHAERPIFFDLEID